MCELADTGLSVTNIGILAGAILCGAFLLFWLTRKHHIHYRFIAAVALFAVALLGSPLHIRSVYAQSAEDCAPTQSDSQDPGSQGVLGALLDDAPELQEESGPMGEDSGNFWGMALVLDNDNAPKGDPFDIATLRLVSDTPPLSGMWEGAGYEIVNPSDTSESWGSWSIVLDCAPFDDRTSREGCPPTNSVYVALNSDAPTGVPFTIQYTVKTMSGATLAPATITVVKPAPSPVTATDSGTAYLVGQNCSPEPWDQNWSLDLMSLFSTTGSGALLPQNIDLDPMTPGRQSTITQLNTTFTVDSNGVVTMTAPTDGVPFNYPSAGFEFRIQDSDGFYSNWAYGLEIQPGGDCT